MYEHGRSGKDELSVEWGNGGGLGFARRPGNGLSAGLGAAEEEKRDHKSKTEDEPVSVVMVWMSYLVSHCVSPGLEAWPYPVRMDVIDIIVFPRE